MFEGFEIVNKVEVGRFGLEEWWYLYDESGICALPSGKTCRYNQSDPRTLPYLIEAAAGFLLEKTEFAQLTTSGQQLPFKLF